MPHWVRIWNLNTEPAIISPIAAKKETRTPLINTFFFKKKVYCYGEIDLFLAKFRARGNMFLFLPKSRARNFFFISPIARAETCLFFAFFVEKFWIFVHFGNFSQIDLPWPFGNNKIFTVVWILWHQSSAFHKFYSWFCCILLSF